MGAEKLFKLVCDRLRVQEPELCHFLPTRISVHDYEVVFTTMLGEVSADVLTLSGDVPKVDKQIVRNGQNSRDEMDEIKASQNRRN